MSKLKTLVFSVLVLISSSSLKAQNISGKILDSITLKPIPFATVQWSAEQGIITNEEGQFAIVLETDLGNKDSIHISSMGYKTLGRTLSEFTDSIYYLSPKTISLSNVIVSNKQYTAEEVIDLVNDNLEKNYNRDFTKKRMFYRERNFQNLNKTNYSDFESTITAFNSQFLDSVIRSIPKTDERYTEVLFDLYGNLDKEQQKIKLIKASELYDKNSEMDAKALEERFNKIIKENVKTTSYFKVKSGIFGSKVDNEDIFKTPVDSTDIEALNKKLEEEQKKKSGRERFFAYDIKRGVSNKIEDLFFNPKTDFDFITKSRKYEYTLEEFSYLGSSPVYVVNFKPKSNADYEGLLYINADDFAVMRADYVNVKSVKTFKLLGVSMNQYLKKGKAIFYKGEQNTYNLRYLEVEDGMSVGINRPLKIIEKNKVVKGRNKQNELSLKMDLGLTSTNKYEIVIFDTEVVDKNTFDSLKEDNSILPKYMPNYNPEFWKGYNIMEPNSAIKEFTSKEI